MGTTTSKPCVFISYRRDDSGGWAGRLEDDLADEFGSQRVFRDMKIPVGVDYQDHIEHVLDSCYVVVVVIGPSWTSLTGSDGARRLTAPDDLLRREIERALQRRDVEVIPVLVQRARMPAAHELPTELRALARRQAIELSDSRWSHDMAQLTSVLREMLRDTTAVALPPVPEPPLPDPPAARRRPERREAIDAAALPGRERLVAAGSMALAAGLGVLVASLFTSGVAAHRGPGAPQSDRIVYFAAERAVIFGIVGALVLAAAAITLRRDRSGAVGCAIVGLGAGVVGGALSGAAYMVLKDQNIVHSPDVLRGVTLAIVGIVLGATLARLVGGERSIYMLAGLAGGLLGGTLAQQLLSSPGQTRNVGMVLFEAVVTTSALAVVATTASPAFAGRRRLPART